MDRGLVYSFATTSTKQCTKVAVGQDAATVVYHQMHLATNTIPRTLSLANLQDEGGFCLHVPGDRTNPCSKSDVCTQKSKIVTKAIQKFAQKSPICNLRILSESNALFCFSMPYDLQSKNRLPLLPGLEIAVI